jgi:hypothetical protein
LGSLRINAPGDIFEQEADRMADQVMASTPPDGPIQPHSAGPVIQRKCACGGSMPCVACEEQKDKIVQRKAGPNPADRAASASAILPQQLGAGRPLDQSTRSFLEPRFGRDFGHVRIHDGTEAAAAACSIGALAYTSGHDIVFGHGQYQPTSEGGRRLLAHELTHVIQQGSLAPSATPRLLQRKPEPGSSTFEESAGPTKTTGDVTEGTVTRKEFGDAHKVIHQGHVKLRFDAAKCELTLPLGVQYREPTAADIQQAQRCDPTMKAVPTAFPKGEGRAIFDRYLAVVNEKLNGWYSARVENCKGAKCAGKDIPIRVEVTEENAAPDYTFAAVKGNGRSCVSGNAVVIVGKEDDVTYAHEGGHMTLGTGDEYKEEGRPIERVRDYDFSLMADQKDYTGWAVLHERHFAFASAFLKATVKAADGSPCVARLVEVNRPTKVDFRISAAIGYSSYSGLYTGAGFDIGFLSRNRDLRFSLGTHATALSDFQPQDRSAYLLGLRVGLEKRFSSSGGLTLGGSGEAGGGSFKIPSAGGRGSATSFGAPYVAGGVSLGYGGSASGLFPSISAETGAGTSIKTEGHETQKFFYLGLRAAFEF